MFRSLARLSIVSVVVLIGLRYSTDALEEAAEPEASPGTVAGELAYWIVLDDDSEENRLHSTLNNLTSFDSLNVTTPCHPTSTSSRSTSD